jgi:predicted nucleic acid-binding OB-fold protein
MEEEKIKRRKEILLKHINNKEIEETIKLNQVQEKEKLVTYEKYEELGIIITIKNQPVNALSNKVLEGIKENIERAYKGNFLNKKKMRIVK